MSQTAVTPCLYSEKQFLFLQERLLGEDGHPRKVHEGEDPHRMGLVLEWVYGTIVSTAEKARDGAKRALGKLFLLGVLLHLVHLRQDQLLESDSS